MVLTLAVLEFGLLSLGISGTVLLWGRPLPLDWASLAVSVGQGFTLALCCVISFYYNDLYDVRRVKSFDQFALRLLQSLGAVFIMLAGLYTAFPRLHLADGPFYSSMVLLILLVLPVRAILYAIMKSPAFRERVLILGGGSLARNIAAEIQGATYLRYSVVGFVDGTDDNPMLAPGSSVSFRRTILGPLENLGEIIKDVRPGRVIVALTERRKRLPVMDLLNLRLSGTLVEDGIETYENITGKLAIETLTPSYLLFSRDFDKPRYQRALRRAISLAASLIGLIASAPLLGIIALLIKLESQGPVLFIQERVGAGGRVFRLMKFRTMRPNRKDATEPVWERDVASRVTRVGKWLRKLRLDELPQFLNILKGDMDLVGPRPEMACNVKAMTEKIPYYSLRHVVRPGITGWAQVKHGYSVSQEDVAEKVRYDLYYIKHMSLWFDLRILMDTVKIVLFGRGAR